MQQSSKEEKAKNANLFLEKSTKEVAKLADSDLVIFVEYHFRAKASGVFAKDFAVAVLSTELVGAFGG